MTSLRVGFVGFGEVASVFSRALREHGADVAAYDIHLTRPGGRALLDKRVRADDIAFCPLPEMVRRSDYVLSVVRPQSAREAAEQCAAHLRAGQVYVDMNSVSPSVKIEVGVLLRPSGATFVEGVILGAVGPAGAAARILTGGEKGNVVADTLTRFGLNAAHFNDAIGKASTFKMLRSILSKGIEALLLEMMIAGRKAGLDRDLWKDLVESLGPPFEREAANWMQSHAVAHPRRHHELLQVMETMRAIGVEPLATAGTEAFFRRSCSLGFPEAFPVKPESPGTVVDFMERRTG